LFGPRFAGFGIKLSAIVTISSKVQTWAAQASVLRFAYGDVEHLLGKLGGIAGTLRHEPSIAQAAP
jgi:hypothetical protein